MPLPVVRWPIPVQSQDEDDEFAPPDSSVYDSLAPFPENPIRLTAEGHMRGYHLMTLEVWPVQFVGALERIVVLREVEIGASVIPLTEEEFAKLHHRHREDWRPWEQRSEIHWMLRRV